MRFGFTGTQRGMSYRQIEVLTLLLRDLATDERPHEFHHGDCVGADSEAHDVARSLGLHVVVHPPLVAAKRAHRHGDIELPAKAYFARNHDIVDSCTLLIAAPLDAETLRSGTWATVRYAYRVRKPVILLDRRKDLT